MFDLQVSADGASWTTVVANASTSGTTTQEEMFDFPDATGRYVRYVGHMSSVGTFNSVTEISVFSPSGVTATPTPTPVSTPTPTPVSTPTPRPVATPTPTPVTPTPTPTGSYVEVTPPASAVSASTSDANVPGNTVDNNLGTRWSGGGDGAWLRLDLGATRTVGYIKTAAYQGNVRQNKFDVQVSGDGSSWTTVLTNASTSGTTTQEETFDFPDAAGRYVRYLGHGNVGSTNLTMNSVTEVSVFALSGPTPTPTPPTPTPTPGPTPTPSPTATPTTPPGFPSTVLLQSGWRMQSSATDTATGAQMSTVGHASSSWYPVTVPSTVLAGLVANGQYPNIFFGNNLQSVPAAQFTNSWWYRIEFNRPEDGNPTTWLGFDGLNYKANIWLNGQQVASSTNVIGTFRTYEYNVSSLIKRGQMNALAVQVFQSGTNDLAITWLDWSPTPPDHNMGIYRDVKLKSAGPVSIRSLQARPHLDITTLASANIEINAELQNTTGQSQSTTLNGTIDGVGFSSSVTLNANETRIVKLDNTTTPSLHITSPRVWWPTNMGSQPMYTLDLTASVAGSASDAQSVKFGIRDVSSSLTSGHRLFKINGKNIQIRGGGWAPDMLLRQSPQRIDAEMRLIKDMGLNTIRIEGKMETDYFYDKTDELGILVMPGWMCCDRWQSTGSWTSTDFTIAGASMHDQAMKMRNHPSIFTFLIGSDTAPPANVETTYLDALNAAKWPTTIISSAAAASSPQLGASGLKMPGPYDWVAPIYWMKDTAAGGAFGFGSEAGPGAAIDDVETLQAALTSTDLSNLWNNATATQYHAGAKSPFTNVGLFNNALNARMGAGTSLNDYVKKATFMTYDGERAPFEAHVRNKYNATGYIHWMLNNAWPSLTWHLYDYSLVPSATYYGAKKGNEPVHILYSYDDQSIAVVNNTRTAMSGLTAAAKVYNLDGSLKYSNSVSVSPGVDSTQKVFTLPAISGLSSVYFVKLDLTGGSGTVSTNFYALSTKGDIHNYGSPDWYFTPITQYADFKALSTLGSASVVATRSSTTSGSDGITNVTLQNTSSVVAFFIRVRLTRGAGGAAVAPVFWEDNYISLAPGETRTIRAEYAVSDLQGASPSVQISGWNVASQTK
jgi:exo-1,4-beta-D-glucosaminidase